MKKNILLIPIVLLSLFQTGCLYETHTSQALKDYQQAHPSASRIGQVRFMLDDLGALNLKSLMEMRVMPTKVYETALLLGDGQLPLASGSVPLVMEKYGFIRPKSIANWKAELGVEPKVDVLGYVNTYIEKEIAGEAFKIQVSTFTCAACHSNRVFGSDGIATDSVWLGSSNVSIDFDSYLNQIYKGLKIATADNAKFVQTIQQVYPNIDESELRVIRKVLLPSVNFEIKKMVKGMDRVLPFLNGGPGNTNGIAAFKRAAKLHKEKYTFKDNEAGYVSIPDINFRAFRSSLLVDGQYSIKGNVRFTEMTVENSYQPEHIKDLAKLTAYFTFAAMGTVLRNIEPIFSNVEEIFRDFLADSLPPRFPGPVNLELATVGQAIYNRSCAQCHGTFAGELKDLRMVSFPNKLVPYTEIGSDNYRWNALRDGVIDFANRQKDIIAYVEPVSLNTGYVAPILSGLWATAPYMHNGSVPDLWSFLNPHLRPSKFVVGGHALDFEKMGVSYPPGLVPKSIPGTYDTTKPGKSNRGHEAQFSGLNVDDKKALLEYLKLL